MCEHCNENKDRREQEFEAILEELKDVKGFHKIAKPLGDKKYEDLAGKKFNRLIAIKPVGRDKGGMILWLCECSCEKHGSIIVRLTNLKIGRPSSCDMCQNLEGKTIGYWTVLKDDGGHKVLARCKCGTIREVIKKNLGKTSMSCGCIKGSTRTVYRHNLEGLQFGHLQVVKKVGVNKDHRALWLCKCDCTNECICNTKELIEKRKTHCGCRKVKRSNAKNLEGMRFGKLVVIKRVENRVYKDGSQRAQWLCKCDCNNEINVTSKALLKGEKTHCGCVKRPSPVNFVDLTGRRFFNLTVIKRVDDLVQENGRHRVRYLCRCDCNNEVIVNADSLTTFNTKSCGCINSYGERKIEELLQKNKLRYKKQKSFSDLKSEKNCALRFDFQILDGDYLIEYDGEQHFISRENGWMTEDVLRDNQHRDELKNEYCKKNNIPLIRIPYTHLDNICLEDLLLETTKFLVN